MTLSNGNRLHLFITALGLVLAVAAACSQPTEPPPEPTETPAPTSTITPSEVLPTATQTHTPTLTPTVPTPTPTLSPQILFNRGVDYQNGDDYNASIEAFSQALRMDPEYTEAYFERGRTHAIHGELELAIEDWSRTIELDAGHMTAHQFRAFSYDDTGQYEKAALDYTVVIKTNPEIADNYFWRGRGFVFVGQIEDAIADFEQALDLGLGDEYAVDAREFLSELTDLTAGKVNFNGYWSGNTDQGEVISFQIENNAIVSYSVGFQIAGCEDLTPFVVYGTEAARIEEGYRFSTDHFTAIDGVFNSDDSAVGSVAIDCEAGLTTRWTVFRGVQAVRTPSPDDLAQLPQAEIPAALYNPSDGTTNFDEYTTVLGDNGDWFLVTSYAESVVPIPSGWHVSSNPWGAFYKFTLDNSAEDFSFAVQVGRECTEVDTAAEAIKSFEDMIGEDPSIVVLDSEIVSDKQGYIWIQEDNQDLGRFYRYLVLSIPSEGCFHFLDALVREDDWPSFLPVYREMVSHWADRGHDLLGFELLEELPEFSD